MTSRKDYTHFYKGIITYIQQELVDTYYQLTFGIVALAEHTPRAIIKFTLTNSDTSLTSRWVTVISGHTQREVVDDVRGTVRPRLDQIEQGRTE